jgi:hypothetical protein
MVLSNPRGQCTLEVAAVMLVLITVMMSLYLTAKRSRSIFRTTVLSKEIK